MPYSLVFKYSNCNVSEMKSICCDNPRSEFNFEDRSILRKATKWAKELTKSHNDLTCEVKHYD